MGELMSGVELEQWAYEKYIRRIRYRILRQNKNWLAIVCGETGSGKSYSALSIGGDIGRVFFVFSPLKFLELINNKKLQRGDVIIFDEAGVGMSSREWYSVQNKLLGSVLQTFRNLNIAVIFTTPDLSFIDIQARKLFHAYIETKHIDQQEELAYIRPFDISVNGRFDKTYYQSPKFSDPNGLGFLTMRYLAINKPDSELVKRYEEAKSLYTQELNKKALAELSGDNKKEKKAFDSSKLKPLIIDNLEKYSIKGRVAPTALRANHPELSQRSAQALAFKINQEQGLL